MTELRLPLDLWEEVEDDTTGSIIWLYPDGAQVNEGDLIAEITVEKTTVELYAPATGTLRIGADPQAAPDTSLVHIYSG